MSVQSVTDRRERLGMGNHRPIVPLSLVRPEPVKKIPKPPKPAILSDLADDQLPDAALWLNVRAPEWRRIQDFAARSAGLRRSDILAPSRIGNITWARQVAAWAIRHYCKASFMRVGALMERDHSSIVSSCRTVDAVIAQYEIDPSRGWPRTVDTLIKFGRNPLTSWRGGRG